MDRTTFVVCLLYLTLSPWVQAEDAVFTSIGESGTVHHVDMEPCTIKHNGNCALKKGTNVTLTMRFTPTVDADSVIHSVAGKVYGVNVPFRGVRGSACDKISPDGCPLVAGQMYEYQNTFPILNIYPKVPVTITYNVMDSKKRKLASISLLTKIVTGTVRRRPGRRNSK